MNIRESGCFHLQGRGDLDGVDSSFVLSTDTYLLDYAVSHPRKHTKYTKRSKFAAIARQFLRQCCYAVKHMDRLGAFSVCHGYRSGTQAIVSHLYGECNTGLFQRVICVINIERHFVPCPYLSACQFAFVLSNNFFMYKSVISFQVNSCSNCTLFPQTRESRW